MIGPSRAPAATLLAAALVTASACNGGGKAATAEGEDEGKADKVTYVNKAEPTVFSFLPAN